MKAFFSVIFFMAIFAFGLSQGSSIIIAEESIPAYSVAISMNKREVYGSQRANISFSILGMGSISYGSVSVYSDAKNILLNTFCIESFVSVSGQTTGSEKFGPIEMLKLKVMSATIPISSIELPTGAQLCIIGGFTINTSEMSLGHHRLKVVFLARLNNENYLFEDSMEYRIISFLEAFPIFQYLIPAGISVVTSVVVVIITQRLLHRKEEDTTSKE